MKTVILTVAMALMSITGMAQMDSIFNYYNGISVDESQAKFGSWSKESGNNLMLAYEPTSVSYKKTLDCVIRITNAAGEDFNNPNLDDGFLPSYVDGLRDYNGMNACLRVESGFISRIWVIKENDATYSILWHCSKDAYAIMIIKY